MKRYVVTGASANFASGVIMLTEEQAKARVHALKDLGDGYFEVMTTVSFKRGEIVGYDGEVNKALLQLVDEIGEAPSAPPAQHAPPAVAQAPAQAPKAGKAPKGPAAGRRDGDP